MPADDVQIVGSRRFDVDAEAGAEPEGFQALLDRGAHGVRQREPPGLAEPAQTEQDDGAALGVAPGGKTGPAAGLYPIEILSKLRLQEGCGVVAGYQQAVVTEHGVVGRSRDSP